MLLIKPILIRVSYFGRLLGRINSFNIFQIQMVCKIINEKKKLMSELHKIIYFGIELIR